MASHEIDIEKGQMSSTARPQISMQELSSQNSTDLPKTPLGLFQLLIGINSHPSLAVPDPNTNIKNGQKKPKTRGVNKGLYQRAKEEERSMSLKFQTTSFINNSLYMLQILLAATFTALSAYKDSNPVTLTVLGAMNTVLAGYVLSSQPNLSESSMWMLELMLYCVAASPGKKAKACPNAIAKPAINTKRSSSKSKWPSGTSS